MLRPLDSILIDTVANFTTHDPIIPYGIFAVNSDGSGFKLGDGINVWSALSYQGSGAIRNKQVQSSREPANNELLLFCDATDKWIYRLQHCFDTVSNWESNTSVFPTSTLLIETDNITQIPTGRFKIGDGATAFPTLPWFGTDFNLSDFSVGESIEFNGSGWDPVTYLKPNELQAATTPTGLFHRDDGTWAIMDTFTGLETVEADQGVFSTVYVGGFPTEATTVTLTSDGTDLFSDGNKVWTEYNDGTGSGLDADTLDGMHSTAFATGPVSAIAGNLVSFGASPNILVDSTYAPSSFAASSHTQFATTVEVLELGTATYDDLQDWINTTQSAGRITGGTLSAHSPADGTVDVSDLKGFVKVSTSNIAETRFFDMASTTISLTDNNANYIYVDYNSGNPSVFATTDRSTINHTTHFTLGRAFRSGTTVDVLNSGINLYNRTRLTHEKWIDIFGGISYASGLTVTCTGLKPAYTAGIMYAGSNKLTINALDCNVLDTFTAYYTTDNGATWTTQTGQTDLNNTQYNDVSTGLATLSNNQYGVHWLYICPNGCLAVLYGKGSYTLAQAQAVAAPVTPIPNVLAQWAKLAAKVIILKSATSVYSITHAWTTAFPVQNPGDHNSLAGLQGGISSEYYHLTATEYNTTVPKYYGSLAGVPATYKAGDEYYNTGDSKFYKYNGTDWIALN